jgi:hypothetical protein
MKAFEEDFQIVGREFLKGQYSTDTTFPVFDLLREP